jgi:hypothetical protein
MTFPLFGSTCTLVGVPPIPSMGVVDTTVLRCASISTSERCAASRTMTRLAASFSASAVGRPPTTICVRSAPVRVLRVDGGRRRVDDVERVRGRVEDVLLDRGDERLFGRGHARLVRRPCGEEPDEDREDDRGGDGPADRERAHAARREREARPRSGRGETGDARIDRRARHRGRQGADRALRGRPGGLHGAAALAGGEVRRRHRGLARRQLMVEERGAELDRRRARDGDRRGEGAVEAAESGQLRRAGTARGEVLLGVARCGKVELAVSKG